MPLHEAAMPVTDLALQRGYGVFDFFLLADGLPLYFEDHWQRLNRSATAMHLKVPFSRDELLDMIAGLYAKTPHASAGVRVTLTGGCSPDGYSLGPVANSLVTLQPQSQWPDVLSEKGFALLSHTYKRAFPQVKSIDYTMGIMMQPIAKAKGFDEVLYVQDGLVSECPRANIFAITQSGTLITPADGVLEGITRMRILKAAMEMMQVESRPVSLAELKEAKEVFISSTTKGMLPVYKIDELEIGNPAAWDISKKLYDLLKARVS